ncbi:MAG: ribosome maturation factor RimM [Thermodesulfobacteriota bacterium]
MRKRPPFSAENYLEIGKVGKAHGTGGEFLIHTFAGRPESFENYSELILVRDDGEPSIPLKVLSVRPRKKNCVVRLDRIDSRRQAEQYVGFGVFVAREELAPVAEDEFYYDELVGINVVTEDGIELGPVKSIFSNGAQDILVIDNGEGELYIPFVDQLIVSRQDDRIVIAPPEGLLEINR